MILPKPYIYKASGQKRWSIKGVAFDYFITEEMRNDEPYRWVAHTNPKTHKTPLGNVMRLGLIGYDYYSPESLLTWIEEEGINIVMRRL